MREFMGGTVEGHLNAERLYKTLERILNESYPGVKFTAKVTRKEDAPHEETKEELPAVV